MSILSQPEQQWETMAQHHGIAYGPDIYQRLKFMEEVKFKDRYSAYKEKAPDLQSLIDFMIMEEMKTEFDHLILEKFRNAEHYKVSDKVFFGTLESNEINASIREVPDSDEFLIIINGQLWELAKLLSFTLACILIDENRGLRLNFDPNNVEPYASIFIQNVAAMLYRSGPIKQIPLLKKDTSRELIWVAFDRSLHDFIMGHEYGHFLLSHFTGASTSNMLPIGEMDISLNTPRWKHEYQADRVGLDLAVFRARESMASTVNPADPMAQDAVAYMMTLGFLGCWACLHLMWRMEQVWGIIYEVDVDHPPTPLRIAAMWGAIFQQMPDERSATYAGEQLTTVAQCIGMLFQPLMGARKNSSPLNTLEAAFQNLVFQAILFDSHKDVIHALEAILPSFRPPYSAPNTMSSIDKKRLVLSGYNLLSKVLWCQTVTWQECITIIEKSILILKKNGSV